MTDTIESMKLDEDENTHLARTMVAQARASGVDLVGPDGLPAGLTKQVLELAIEEELEHDTPLGGGGGHANGLVPNGKLDLAEEDVVVVPVEDPGVDTVELSGASPGSVVA